mgnify:CR=1 FL=1
MQISSSSKVVNRKSKDKQNDWIDIAYPQVVINYSEAKEFKTSSQEKKSAQEFVQEQKILSHDLEDQDK